MTKLDEAVEIIRDLLRAGSHEGRCTNEDEPFPKENPCYIHLENYENRKVRAEKFLKSVEDSLTSAEGRV